MILFWKTREPYGEFSNFFIATIVIDGKDYKTSEHYYQSKKFEGSDWEEHIRNQPTARLAANEGRREDLPLRPDWDEVKEDVMYRVLQEKFKVERFKNLLLVTGDEEIVEHSPKDRYWGQYNGEGLNRLGELLMKLRSEIKEKDETTFF